MKILLVPDKFRGSLTATEVATCMAEGIKNYNALIEITQQPMADGGEGTAQLLTEATGGYTETIEVLDPLFRPIKAAIGFSANSQQAFIEMAEASGLSLLAHHERNPLNTSTIGTGQLIAHALNKGVEEIILCIGGSATTDAGIGMATALGYRFLDSEGQELLPIGGNLGQIQQIDTSAVHPRLSEVKFRIACDVENPLFGPNGAAYVYAPQKGASMAHVKVLDEALKNFDTIMRATENSLLNYTLLPSCNAVAGAGAAGGLGYGAMVFLNGTLQSGVELVADTIGLEQKIAEADLIITGEGKIDAQTLSGKLIGGIVKLSRKYRKPVVALCGTLLLSPKEIRGMGLLYATSILTKPQNLATAQTEVRQQLRNATENLIPLFW